MGLEVSFEGVHSSLRQDLTSDGSEFQVCGAATEKDRRANSELCDRLLTVVEMARRLTG